MFRIDDSPVSLRLRAEKALSPWEVRFDYLRADTRRQGSRSFRTPREATAFGTLVLRLGAELACAVLQALRTGNEFRFLLANTDPAPISESMNTLLRSFGYRDRFAAAPLPQMSSTAGVSGGRRAKIYAEGVPLRVVEDLPTPPSVLPTNALDHSLRFVKKSLDQTELAMLLRVDRRLVGDWTRIAKIRASKLGHGWEYAREDLLRFLEDGANGLALLALDDPRSGLKVAELYSNDGAARFFAVEEAAKLLAYTPAHINVLARENLLAATRVGRSWIIPVVGIAIFRAQRANTTR